MAKTQNEMVLITEDKTGIELLNQLANVNVGTLNEILALAPELNNENEILRAVSNLKQFILSKFFLINPDAERLSQYSKIDFVYPLQLERLQNLLSTVTVRTFQLVWFNSKGKPPRWQIDKQDLELQSKRYQKWAITPEEISRWEFANRYVKFLKDEMKCGNLALRKMSGEIMVSKGGDFVPNPNFPFNQYQF